MRKWTGVRMSTPSTGCVYSGERGRLLSKAAFNLAEECVEFLECEPLFSNYPL